MEKEFFSSFTLKRATKNKKFPQNTRKINKFLEKLTKNTL